MSKKTSLVSTKPEEAMVLDDAALEDLGDSIFDDAEENSLELNKTFGAVAVSALEASTASPSEEIPGFVSIGTPTERNVMAASLRSGRLMQCTSRVSMDVPARKAEPRGRPDRQRTESIRQSGNIRDRLVPEREGMPRASSTRSIMEGMRVSRVVSRAQARLTRRVTESEDTWRPESLRASQQSFSCSNLVSGPSDRSKSRVNGKYEAAYGTLDADMNESTQALPKPRMSIDPFGTSRGAFEGMTESVSSQSTGSRRHSSRELSSKLLKSVHKSANALRKAGANIKQTLQRGDSQ